MSDCACGGNVKHFNYHSEESCGFDGALEINNKPQLEQPEIITLAQLLSILVLYRHSYQNHNCCYILYMGENRTRDLRCEACKQYDALKEGTNDSRT